MTATPEARLRAAVLKRIREDYPPSKRQVLVFGRPANASTGPGHPDLFGVTLGRFLALEIKLPKAQPTPLQVERIADLRRAGAYAWIIRSTLDATRAVYQAKIGGRVPMPEDPIDFDDWFKSISGEPAKDEPRSAFAEAATKGDDIPLEEDEDVGHERSDLLESIGAQAEEPAPPVEIPEPTPVREPSAEALAEMPEVNSTGARRGHYAGRVQPVAHVTDDGVLQAIEQLEKIIRTVGDRVTEVYEGVNRVETLLRSRHNLLSDVAQEVIGMREILNKLLTEVGMLDEVQPPQVEEPTPFDDVAPPDGEPAETPKRGRGRPRKS